MKESEKSVFFFSPAVLIITVVLCTLLLQTFCSVLLNFADQNHSRCGLSRRGLRIKGLLVIERSSTMRALEKLGLLIIKKSGFTTVVVFFCTLDEAFSSQCNPSYGHYLGNLSVLSNAFTYF